MLLNKTLYAIFVALGAFSPVLSIVLCDVVGLELSLWTFMWVGVLLSLPVSLLGARAFGRRTYRSYWAYLESFPGHSKGGIKTGWAIISGVMLVAGIMALAM